MTSLTLHVCIAMTPRIAQCQDWCPEDCQGTVTYKSPYTRLGFWVGEGLRAHSCFAMPRPIFNKEKCGLEAMVKGLVHMAHGS